MMLTLPALVAAVCLVAVFQLYRFSVTNMPKGAKPLPGKPFIGSGGELKKGKGGYFWFKFTDSAKQYGPIYQYKTLGKVNVVLSSEAIANELLRERGDSADV